MSGFFPVFVLGLGEKARSVVQHLKVRIEAEGPCPYLVYLTVSMEGAEAPYLRPRLEDYRLSPRSPRVGSRGLEERYGPLTQDETVGAVLGDFSLKRQGLYTLLAEDLLDLSNPQRWEGMPPARPEVDFYLVVDLEDPLCLTLPDWIEMLRQLTQRHFLLVHPLLLSLNLGPYAWPMVGWLGEQFRPPLHSGAILIEKVNEQGYEGLEEDRLAVAVEWLYLRIHDQPPRDQLPFQPSLGSLGMALGKVPREPLNHYFALQWGSEFLHDWTRVFPEGPSLSSDILAEGWRPFENLVQKPAATATVPPNYGAEFKGALAPSSDLQIENARLCKEGEVLSLTDSLLGDIQLKIAGQETHGHEIFLRNLRERGQGVLRRAQQALDTQVQGFFGSSPRPFAEIGAFLDQTLQRLAKARRRGEDQIGYLNELEQKGLFQETPPQKPSPVIQMWRGFLFLLVALMAVEGLFIGIRTLLTLWPSVQAQPLPFLGVVGLLLALIALVVYDVQVIKNRKGIVIIFFFLPLNLDLRDLILWNILFNVGLNLLLLLFQLWPKFQLYELSLVGRVRRIGVAQNYQHAKGNAEDALTKLNAPLLIYRFLALLVIFVLALLRAHPLREIGFWDLLETFPGNWPRWLWPPIGLAVIFLSKYFFVDVIGAESHRAVGRLIIPARLNEWLGGLLRLVLIGWGVVIVLSLYLGLSGQEWPMAAGWSLVITFLAVARFAWEYFNDRERLILLAKEWVEWHDGMAFLRFHMEAWKEALHIHQGVEQTAQALRQEVESFQDVLASLSEQWDADAQAALDQVKRLLQESRFPRYILKESPDSLYVVIQQRAADLSKTLIEQHGSEFWQARSQPDNPLYQALRQVVEAETEAFWQERDILRQLPPPAEWLADEKHWFLEPAHPFWSNWNWRLDPRIYLGLPVGTSPEDPMVVEIGRIMSLPKEEEVYEARPPSIFYTDPWTITALYLRIGASPEDLRSWSAWEHAHQEALRRLEEMRQVQEPS